MLTIYNDGNATVFVGPSGVTASGTAKGIPLEKRQEMVLPAGDIAVYMISVAGGVSCIVQEMS